MTQQEVNAIERSVIASVEDILRRHGLTEAILIFKIPFNRAEIKISVSYCRDKNNKLELENLFFQVQELFKHNAKWKDITRNGDYKE